MARFSNAEAETVAGRQSTAAICAAAAPQRGQCLLPMNIMPKHDGQATVASRELQYWHCVESEETAAPQLKQFRVSACMRGIVAVDAGMKARSAQKSTVALLQGRVPCAS